MYNDNKLRILFISSNKRNGSSIMRADTISNSLNSFGITSTYIGIKKLKYCKHYYLNKYDIFIFIKKIDLKIVKSIKKAKKITIVDTIDNFNFNSEPYIEKDYIDYYIANTNDHKKFLHNHLKIGTSKIFIIPHHHSNLNNLEKKITTYKTFGFIGEKTYFQNSKKLTDFFNNKNLDFYIPDKSPISNKEAVEETLKLDCFILNTNPNILRKSGNIYDYIIKFKPAQKILLPFSLGIPTILTPLSSYKDAILESGYKVEEFLMASSEDELIIELNKFLKFSDEEKNNLIFKQKQVASNYTLEKISKMYILMFQKVSTLK